VPEISFLSYLARQKNIKIVGFNRMEGGNMLKLKLKKKQDDNSFTIKNK